MFRLPHDAVCTCVCCARCVRCACAWLLCRFSDTRPSWMTLLASFFERASESHGAQKGQPRCRTTLDYGRDYERGRGGGVRRPSAREPRVPPSPELTLEELWCAVCDCDWMACGSRMHPACVCHPERRTYFRGDGDCDKPVASRHVACGWHATCNDESRETIYNFQ
jgi:hypothetical protein